MGNDLINCPFVVKPPKNSKGQGLESFHSDKHAGRVVHPSSWGQSSWAWGPSGSYPMHLSIELCIHTLHRVLYNKPKNVMCVPEFYESL